MAEEKGKVIIIGEDQATPAFQRVSRGAEGLRDVVLGLGIDRTFFAALGAVQNFVTGSVQAFTEYQASQQGVIGVAGAFHQDINATSEAIRDYIKDGLVPVTNASNAFKNLMSSGFNLQQTIDLLNAAKDTASFNRQAFFTLGQAVDSFTQGIKNQNSILSDSAGIQKNLSVILSEQGFSLQDLTDKTKGAAARQALYSGILRESSFAAGDHEKVLKTLSGQFSKLDTNIFLAKKEFGAWIAEGVTPAVASLNAMLEAIAANVPLIIQLTKEITALGVAFALVFSESVIGIIASWGTALVAALDAVGAAVLAATGELVAFGTVINVGTFGGATVLVTLIAALTLSFNGWMLILEQTTALLSTLWDKVIVDGFSALSGLIGRFFGVKSATDPLNNSLKVTKNALSGVAGEAKLLDGINKKLGTNFTDVNLAVAEQHREFNKIIERHKVLVDATNLSSEAVKAFQKTTERFSAAGILARLRDLTIEFDLLSKEHGPDAALRILSDEFIKLGDDAKQSGVKTSQFLESLVEDARRVKKAFEDEKRVREELADSAKQLEASAKLESDVKKDLEEITQRRIEQMGREAIMVRQVAEEEKERARLLRLTASEVESRRIATEAAVAALVLQTRAETLLDAQILFGQQSLKAWQEKGILPAILGVKTLSDVTAVLVDAQIKHIVISNEQAIAILRIAAAQAALNGNTEEYLRILERMKAIQQGASNSTDEHRTKISALSAVIEIARAVFINLGTAIVNAYAQGGVSAVLNVKFLKKAIGDALVSEGISSVLKGLITIAQSIWPPNAIGLKGGSMQVAAGLAAIAAGRAMGGGGTAAATGGASASAAGAGGRATSQPEAPPQAIYQITMLNQGTVVGANGMNEFARMFIDKINEHTADNVVLR